MSRKRFDAVIYDNLDEFVFGSAKKPLAFSNGMVIGGGIVYPEINFTLAAMTIAQETMSDVRRQYTEMVTGVCKRAVELAIPGIVIEIELLPPLTTNPQWGVEVTSIVKNILADYEANEGLKGLLRMTPVDIREGNDIEHMWRGRHWDTLLESFALCGAAGADFLAIESIGGKNLHDDAVMYGDLAKSLFALGVVGAKDMGVLWRQIVAIANATESIPSGDTACGFANTAMVLAEKGYVSRVFSAVVRVMSAVRSLVAYEQGALGPHKDCGYEGVYVKAITGTPISMEGRTSACAHLSTVGNISGALADLWSNESVENTKLLSDMAPTVYLEQLAYDCRLFNEATAQGKNLVLRDLLTDSDSALDPQAYVLRPDVVLDISRQIVEGHSVFDRIKIAASATIDALRKAIEAKDLQIIDREKQYLDMVERQLGEVEDCESDFTARMIAENTTVKFEAEKYDL